MEPFPLDFANIFKATTHPQGAIPIVEAEPTLDTDGSTAEPAAPEAGVVSKLTHHGTFSFRLR